MAETMPEVGPELYPDIEASQPEIMQQYRDYRKDFILRQGPAPFDQYMIETHPDIPAEHYEDQADFQKNFPEYAAEYQKYHQQFGPRELPPLSPHSSGLLGRGTTYVPKEIGMHPWTPEDKRKIYSPPAAPEYTPEGDGKEFWEREREYTGLYGSEEVTPKVTGTFPVAPPTAPTYTPPGVEQPTKWENFKGAAGKYLSNQKPMSSFQMAKAAGAISLVNNLMQRPPAWVGAPQIQAKQVPFRGQIFDKAREQITQQAVSQQARGQRNIASLSDRMAYEQQLSQKKLDATSRLSMAEQEAQMKVDSENARLELAAQQQNQAVSQQNIQQNIQAQSKFAQDKATAISKDVQGLITTQGLQEQYNLEKEAMAKNEEIQKRALDTQATIMGFHASVNPDSYQTWKDQQLDSHMKSKAAVAGIDLDNLQTTDPTAYDTFKESAFNDIKTNMDWNKYRKFEAERMGITDEYVMKALGLL
jgi:hypothetical protein